jgi:hypothetical protein
MGSLAAVARVWHKEPQLIVLRYEPPDATGALVAAVGKGVTSTLPLNTGTPSGCAAGSRPRQLRRVPAPDCHEGGPPR